MADEIDPLKNGEGEGGNIPPENKPDPSSGKPAEAKADEEPKVPLSRLREEVQKRQEIERKLYEGSDKVPDEKRIKDVFLKVKKEEEDAARQAEKEFDSKIGELRKVYGEFNKDNLLKIISEYGVYNEDGSVKWDKAMDLYERLGGNPNPPKPKKKMPTGERTGDEIKKEEENLSGKTMWQIAEEAKRGLS